MKITQLMIKNFMSIKELEVTDIENTLIFVGKNNVGKSSILNGIKLLCGEYVVSENTFHTVNEPIEIRGTLKLYEHDFLNLFKERKVSKHRKFEKWSEEFRERITLDSDDVTTVTLKVYPNGETRYGDALLKINPYVQEILPTLNIINERRDMEFLDSQLMDIHGFPNIEEVMKNVCIFDHSRPCNGCFDCIGFINKKSPMDLTLTETFKLVNYQLYSTNLKKYADSINKFFKQSYGNQYEINYKFDFDIESLLKVHTMVKNHNIKTDMDIKDVSSSMKSLYILSLFQAYLEVEGVLNSMIIIEQPELHLHPELQKIASEIIYKLSKKNQVFFTTHSPHMLYNFSSKQIKQITVGREEHDTIIGPAISIDQILDDLGYSANDLMNADFVFIVEGKDDRSRLPLFLDKYYSEIRSQDGELNRIAIIPTNSCTNIKTYANLKFINRGYLKKNFLMIRDSDGHNPERLVQELCHYYDRRIKDDDANIPRITPDNVLVLKYYSIENYFLNPKVMVQLGVIESEEAFYEILLAKYKQYLYRLKSARWFYKKTQIYFNTVDDIKNNMELIKTYIRGHNLFDIFYGKYHSKQEQQEILKAYIDIAPKEDFDDLLSSIDHFIYFENRRKKLI